MLPLWALGFCCGMFCFVRRRGVSLYSPATIYLPQAPLRSGQGRLSVEPELRAAC